MSFAQHPIARLIRLGSLALREVGPCAEGAVTLCTALAQSSSLHTLDLSANSIGVSDGLVVVPAPAPPAEAAAGAEEGQPERAGSAEPHRAVVRARRGPFAIIPPTLSFIWRIPIGKTKFTAE